MHRKIYEWTIHWARTPQASKALALLVARPRRSFAYAALCSVFSVLGGMLGYLIGWAFWEAASPLFFGYIPGFTEEAFARVAGLYQKNAFLTVFSAGFTPIPYKVFTIAGGVCRISFATLVAASIIGRSGRFFLVGGLIYFVRYVLLE